MRAGPIVAALGGLLLVALAGTLHDPQDDVRHRSELTARIKAVAAGMDSLEQSARYLRPTALGRPALADDVVEAGDTVAIETPVRGVLAPFTAKRYRGTIRYRALNVGPRSQWQQRAQGVSIVFDPDEVRSIVDRDEDRFRKKLTPDLVSPYFDTAERKSGAFQCTEQ